MFYLFYKPRQINNLKIHNNMLYNKLLLALAYVEFNTYKNRFLILIVIDVERFKKIKSRNQQQNSVLFSS